MDTEHRQCVRPVGVCFDVALTCSPGMFAVWNGTNVGLLRSPGFYLACDLIRFF